MGMNPKRRPEPCLTSSCHSALDPLFLRGVWQGPPGQLKESQVLDQSRASHRAQAHPRPTVLSHFLKQAFQLSFSAFQMAIEFPWQDLKTIPSTLLSFPLNWQKEKCRYWKQPLCSTLPSLWQIKSTWMKLFCGLNQ